MLNATEKKVFALYAAYAAQHDGESPTYQYVASILGKSAVAIWKAVVGLEIEGYVKRMGRQQRGVRIIRHPGEQIPTCPHCGHSIEKKVA